MRRSPLIALLVVLPIFAFLAGCGASGGDDADSGDKTTTTAASGSDDGADEPVDDPTTTAADDGDDGGSVSSAALVDILPTVEDIGSEYEVSDENLGDDADDDSSSDDEDEADDERDPIEEAMIEQCPGAEFLDELDDGGQSTTEVSREFENQAEATIEVSLDPSPTKFNEDTVDKVVEALSDCGPIEATDGDSQVTMTIEADHLDDHGDFGLTMTMTAEYTMMGSTIPIEFHGMIFSVDGVAVSVIATSGLDPETYELVEGDYDLLPDLAGLMEERVSSL